jgi:hypothetical protein
MADEKLSAIPDELANYNDATARLYGAEITTPKSVYALFSKLVNTLNSQTIAGVKTFSSFPVTPSSAPITDYQSANKKYVDDNLGFIKISAADTTNGYLNSKISVSGGIKEILNPSGNEILDIKFTSLYQPDGTNPFVYTDNGGALHIDGDIIQEGAAYETHLEQVYTKDDLIITRDGAVGGLVAGVYTGFQAKLYNGVNDGQLVFDNQGWAYVGDVGDLARIAAIENSPTDGLFTYYDNTTQRLKTRALISSDISDFSTAVKDNGYWQAVTGGINYAGGSVGIGATPSSAKVQISRGVSGAVEFSNTLLAIEDTTTAIIQMRTSNTGVSGIMFGNEDSQNDGYIRYSNSDHKMQFFTNNTSHVAIDANGNLDVAGHISYNTAIVSIAASTTLDITYANKIIEATNTITITLPDDMPQGYKVDIINVGTGVITLAASTTLETEDSNTKIATQTVGVSAYHRGSNIWAAVGKLTA